MTTTTNEPTIGGEPVLQLAKCMTAFDFLPSKDGALSCQAAFDSATSGPVLRALMRLEAELLLADADLVGEAGKEPRSREERLVEAQSLLMNGLLEVAVKGAARSTPRT